MSNSNVLYESKIVRKEINHEFYISDKTAADIFKSISVGLGLYPFIELYKSLTKPEDQNTYDILNKKHNEQNFKKQQ